MNRNERTENYLEKIKESLEFDVFYPLKKHAYYLGKNFSLDYKYDENFNECDHHVDLKNLDKEFIDSLDKIGFVVEVDSNPKADIAMIVSKSLSNKRGIAFCYKDYSVGKNTNKKAGLSLAKIDYVMYDTDEHFSMGNINSEFFDEFNIKLKGSNSLLNEQILLAGKKPTLNKYYNELIGLVNQLEMNKGWLNLSSQVRIGQRSVLSNDIKKYS